MRKLRLKLDCEELAVESFPTTREMIAAEGTIHGHADNRSGITCLCTTLLTKPTQCPCTPRDGEPAF